MYRVTQIAGVGLFCLLASSLLLLAGCGTAEDVPTQQAKNNLRQLALAMREHCDNYNALPAPANYDEDGKPLLSWRVHILPRLGQWDLYVKFKLDEPWDSEHNKQLIKEMPSVYLRPGKTTTEEYTTCFLVPVGKRTAFPKGRPGSAMGIHLGEIQDGLSNVIMIIEAAPDKAVVWTKPDDWQFDPDNPKQGLVGHRSGFFLAALCDASVRTLSPEKLDAETIKRFVMRNDGFPVELP